MLGASSEDIRLSDILTVKEYGAIETGQTKTANPVSASTNGEMKNNVLDNNLSTVWEGNKGDYITFAL